MEILLVVALFIAAFMLMVKRRYKKLLSVFSLAMVVGGIAIAIDAYYYHKTTCGSLYDSDIGCSNQVPWVVPLGIGAALVAIFTSLAAIRMYFYDKRVNPKHDA